MLKQKLILFYEFNEDLEKFELKQSAEISMCAHMHMQKRRVHCNEEVFTHNKRGKKERNLLC